MSEGLPSVQHAITRLLEERRILQDIYRQAQRDGQLTPAQRGTYLAQLHRELAELKHALRILGATAPIYERGPVAFAWDNAPSDLGGLRT